MIWLLGFNIYILSILGLIAFLYYSNRENLRGKSVREVINSCFHWTFLTPFINTLALVVICFVYVTSLACKKLFNWIKGWVVLDKINKWLDETKINL